MDALDGNAIGGALLEVFGREMTAASGACRSCGAIAQIAELAVFARAPGTVVRCRSCESVVIVLVEVRGQTRAHLDGFALKRAGS